MADAIEPQKPIIKDPPVRIRSEIRSAIRELQSRCLYQSATWAAEMLHSLPPTPSWDATGVPGAAPSSSHTTTARKGGEDGAHEGRQQEGEEEESDAVILGRLYLQNKEYRRAAHILKQETGRLAFFLRNYALLLAGEKRKEEEAVELGNLQPASAQQPTNAELPRLLQELEKEERSNNLDAFGLFLYGLVLVKWEQKDKAVDMLLGSLNIFPCNWSAWAELQSLCAESVTFERILPRLKPHWARSFWEIATLVELHKNNEGVACCEALAWEFPRNCHLIAHAATAKYNLRDFDAAETMFEELLSLDPFRIQCIDTYSNILYVKERFAALSHLAHQMVLLDKYRPETCCVIGNYFSLKGRHERAVVYFRRALRLNKQYLSAWTLMGHEYVEMKNTPAAIEAYRNAVDINPRDYRAWYGLGQTYEILALPYYALYYYRKATEVRPYDARMWCALGQCYESEQLSGGGAGGGAGGGGVSGAGGGSPGNHQMQYRKAIRCYERAYQYNDSDGIALQKLAKLHEALGRIQTAAFYYKKNLERLEAEQVIGPELVEALLFLGNFHRTTGELDLAEQFCSRLLDFSGPAKEEAKALLRDIRSMQQHGAQVRQSLQGTPQGHQFGGQGPTPDEEEHDDELEGFEEDAAMDLGETP